MVRCRYALEKHNLIGQKNYQVRCTKEAKKEGYCMEHYYIRQKTVGELSSESHLETPPTNPLTKHSSRGDLPSSRRMKFSRKYGKKGKIKDREKVE